MPFGSIPEGGVEHDEQPYGTSVVAGEDRGGRGVTGEDLGTAAGPVDGVRTSADLLRRVAPVLTSAD